MTSTKNYTEEARSDAQDMAMEFIDQMVEQLVEAGEVSDDINSDYPNGDSYHHEKHVDRWYNLQDAATVLDELSNYEETDSGLWEGLAPRDAIGAQAAYTYGNAVYSMWRDVIKDINNDPILADMVTDERQKEDDGGELDTQLIRSMVEQIIKGE